MEKALSDTGQSPELLCQIGALPGAVFDAEVAEAGGIAEDGSAQLQTADNGAGGHVAGPAQQLNQLFVADSAGAVGIDVDGDGLCHADGIGQLDLDLLGKISDEKMTEILRETVDLTPAGIIRKLNLRRPIYAATAEFGHFGVADRPWEQTDLVDQLKKLANI